MRVSGIFIALCLCFSAISARKVMKDDNSILPRPSEGASAVTLNGKIYISGGVRTEADCATCPPTFDTITTKLRIFEIETGAFAAELPAHMIVDRSFHSSVIYQETIVVFGGAGNNQLEQYDIANNVWSIIEPLDDHYSWTPLGERPSARWGHGAAVIEDHMYIYGGFDATSGNALDDLWTFDFKTSAWKSWEVHGGSPNPRGGFSLSATRYAGVDTLILFGGMDSSKYYNELWMFNTNTYTWKHITPVNGPSPRAFHSAVVFEQTQLVIFGGSSANADVHGLLDYYNDVWTISVARPQYLRRWSQVKFEEANLKNFPDARHKHVASAWSNGTGEDYFMIFSGANNNTDTLSDVWRCQLIVDPSDVGMDGDDVIAPEYGMGSLNKNISAQRLYRYNRFYGEFVQQPCHPGYFKSGSTCMLDCRSNSNCSRNGQCQFGGTCCCDEGFSGDSCEVATCTGYNGFTAHELNKVLLPAAIELTITKLQNLKYRLNNLQQILSSVSHSQVNMSAFATSTHHFSSDCLDLDIIPQATCFEEIVGCEKPCGAATKCWEGDYCVNGQCIGGEPVDCSHSNVTNKCVNAWCDEATGECQVSSVNCDDEDPCTEDMCEPSTGVCTHHSLSACDDGSCCTLDFCDSTSGKAVCYHTSKCEDYNPCTVDSCCETCSFGTCTYKWDDNCYLSLGQNTQLNPTDPGTARSNGNAIKLTGDKVVGGIPHAGYSAGAYFWLQSSDCKLVYDISYDASELKDGDYETGAFLYGNANQRENSGVVYTLPLGSHKTGVWSYCNDGVTIESLRQGQIYAEIYFSSGAIRAQVEFYDPMI